MNWWFQCIVAAAVLGAVAAHVEEFAGRTAAFSVMISGFALLLAWRVRNLLLSDDD